MSIRSRPRRRRGSVATRLFAVGALVASLAGSVVLAGAAAADTNCPSFQAVGFTWTEEFSSGGVTLCKGEDVDANTAVLQIIDLDAGAKIRVASEVDPDSTSPADNTQFFKNSAEGWWGWVSNGGITSPDPSQLFSTMNASFFVDTGLLDDETRLSMPEMVDFGLRTYGWAHHTPGAGEVRDAAWDVDKLRLELSTPYPNILPPAPQNQYAAICSFPTHYGIFDASLMSSCDSLQYKDVLVGFQPLAGVDGNPMPPSADPRTMVGTDGQGKIFTVQFPSATLNETQEFLQSLGSTSEIQLDGGCSAQFSDRFGWNWAGETIPGVCPRPVPDVLAVYTAS